MRLKERREDGENREGRMTMSRRRRRRGEMIKEGRRGWGKDIIRRWESLFEITCAKGEVEEG